MVIHPSLTQRKIIHFDMDAFYAAIEMRDDPTLRGRPVIIGGSPQSRGVVCTASYEARKFGVRSAISCAKAARLCPQAIFLRPDFAKYQLASRQIRQVFQKYTSLIEPMSLDEAYLDVTNNKHGLFAAKIAKLIQEEIFETIQLTGSAGVGPNKLVAKIASDIRKPFGLTVVIPEKVQDFMGPLPLRKIHGIGPVTEQRLAKHQLIACHDVWPYSIPDLEAKVGSSASWLYYGSRGIDERPVDTSSERKSLGREETFARDILELPALEQELTSLARAVAKDLIKSQLYGRTVTLKVRYDDFSRISRSRTLNQATNDWELLEATAKQLLELTQAGQRKIRLLGISLANFVPAICSGQKLDLFARE